jgi:phage recombination protein Bet
VTVAVTQLDHARKRPVRAAQLPALDLFAVADVHEPPAAPVSALTITADQHWWTGHQLGALAELGIRNASDDTLALFLHHCQRTRLDPFSGQIHLIDRHENGRRKWTVQTGIDGFRLVAERTGAYKGQTPQQWCGLDGVWREVWTEDGPPVAARIGVRKRGYPKPIYAVAVWREYCVRNHDGMVVPFWSRMSSHMLSKVAEALAIRKAFPQSLSGIYTTDELDRFDTAVPVGPAAPAPARRAAAARRSGPLPIDAEPDVPVDWDECLRAAEACAAAAAVEMLRDLYVTAVMANRRGQCPDEVVHRIIAAGETAVLDFAREEEAQLIPV